MCDARAQQSGEPACASRPGPHVGWRPNPRGFSEDGAAWGLRQASLVSPPHRMLYRLIMRWYAALRCRSLNQVRSMVMNTGTVGSSLRLSATLLLVGQLLYIVVTLLHTGGE